MSLALTGGFFTTGPRGSPGLMLLRGGITLPTLGPASPQPCPQAAHLLDSDLDPQTRGYRDGGGRGRAPRSTARRGEGRRVIQTCQFPVTNGTTGGVTASSKASMTCDDWGLDEACSSRGRKSDDVQMCHLWVRSASKSVKPLTLGPGSAFLERIVFLNHPQASSLYCLWSLGSGWV